MKTSDISDLVALRAVRAWQIEGRPFITERIVAATGAPLKVAESKLARLDSKRFLEWGVSIRTAWLTDAGRRELSSLEQG